MDRNALDVLREYLTNPEIQVRKNVASALAAMADQDRSEWLLALRALIDMAVSDDNTEVRKFAEDEILRLENENAIKEAGLQAAALLKSEEIDLPSKGYALLGRLRQRGFKVPRPPGSLIRRVIMSAKLNETVKGVNWSLIFSGFKGAAIGSTLALLLSLKLLGLSLGVHANTLLATVLVTTPAAILFSMITAWRNRPIGSQYDPKATALVEIITAGIWGIAGTFVIVILIAFALRWEAISWPITLTNAAMLLLLVLAVRIGTVLSYGTWREYGVNFWIQVSAGTSLGMAVALFWLTKVQWSEAGNTDIQQVQTLVVASALTVGLSWSYSSVDRAVSPQRPFLNKYPRFLTTLTLLLLPVISINLVTQAPTQSDGLVSKQARKMETPLRSPSLSKPFEIMFSQGFHADITDQGKFNYELSLYGVYSDASSEKKEEKLVGVDDQENLRIDTLLVPGTYLLELKDPVYEFLSPFAPTEEQKFVTVTARNLAKWFVSNRDESSLDFGYGLLTMVLNSNEDSDSFENLLIQNLENPVFAEWDQQLKGHWLKSDDQQWMYFKVEYQQETYFEVVGPKGYLSRIKLQFQANDGQWKPLNTDVLQRLKSNLELGEYRVTYSEEQFPYHQRFHRLNVELNSG